MDYMIEKIQIRYQVTIIGNDKTIIGQVQHGL